MKTEQIVATISRMRDRAAVQRIANAAEARDTALSDRESARISKRVFSRFESLKKGDTVFIHNLPRAASNKYKDMFGKPLTVTAVHPKNRAIKVVYARTGGMGPLARCNVALRWSVLDRLKVSTVPTPEALASLLNKGE